MAGTRVMLADNKGWNELKIAEHLREAGFLWQQPKIDGMRVYADDRLLPLSRSGKEFKQRYLRQFFKDHPSFMHVDCEAASGLQNSLDTFRESMSGIRAEDGSPEFTLYLLDYPHPDWAHYRYQDRRNRLIELLHGEHAAFYEDNGYTVKVIVVPQVPVKDLQDIYDNDVSNIEAGWEGSIIRRDDRPYKFGRSTINEAALVKLKGFEDAEAIVVGYEPWERNDNDATSSPLGYTARSSHQDGKTSLERLGALQVELFTDRSVKFSIGVMRGVTHTDRDRLWVDRESLIGRICKFTHQGYGGGYTKPRTPVWLGWRNILDI